MRKTMVAVIATAALLVTEPSRAFMVVPSDDAPGDYIVVIENALGDRVPLAALPPPYDGPGGPGWPEAGLTFAWRYFRSPERGAAMLAFDADGHASISFEFSGWPLAHDDTIAAATAFVDADGRAIATVYAAARVDGASFASGTNRVRVSASVDKPSEGWEAVAALTFFVMKYYAIQRLDDDAVALAMRRAVHRVTGEDGREVWTAEVE